MNTPGETGIGLDSRVICVLPCLLAGEISLSQPYIQLVHGRKIRTQATKHTRQVANFPNSGSNLWSPQLGRATLVDFALA